MENWLYIVLVGGIAGWLGSWLYKGSGSGMIKNIVLGILGAIVGGWLFEKLNIQASGLKGSILTAAVGAFVVLWVFNLITGGGRRRR